MKYLLLSIVLLIVFSACRNSTVEESVPVVTEPAAIAVPAVTEPASTEPSAVNKVVASALPSLKMINTSNQVVDLSQFGGKKVFVNLWATWCPPCRAEIPSIESLGAKTDKNKVEFVLLSLDDNFEKAKSYAARNGMKLPVYYPAGNLPQLFNVEGIPVTYIFNEKGDVIYQQVGSANYDTKEFLDILNK